MNLLSSDVCIDSLTIVFPCDSLTFVFSCDRMKARDIEQLRALVTKLDTQLVETEEQAIAAKDENAQLAAEMIER